MKKGFTLIELLAVIVILAVIAIIAIPVITNVIESAKKGALKDSAYGIIDSGELYLAKNMSKEIDTIEFTCSNGKCISNEEEIDYKGKIDSGKIKLYSDGKISVCVENGINSAIKLATEKEVTVKKGNCNYTGESYEIDEVVSLTKYNELKNELNELKDKGDAEASNILINKKAVVKGLEITGTMPNNGAWVGSTTSNGKITIPKGYHNGLGYVSGADSYNAGLSASTLSTKTLSQTVSFKAVERKSIQFTFSDISKVYGIVSIKKIGVGTYGYHNQFDVSYDKLLSYIQISNNIVSLQLYSGVDVASSSTWEVTVVGK